MAAMATQSYARRSATDHNHALLAGAGISSVSSRCIPANSSTSCRASFIGVHGPSIEVFSWRMRCTLITILRCRRGAAGAATKGHFRVRHFGGVFNSPVVKPRLNALISCVCSLAADCNALPTDAPPAVAPPTAAPPTVALPADAPPVDAPPAKGSRRRRRTTTAAATAATRRAMRRRRRRRRRLRALARARRWKAQPPAVRKRAAPQRAPPPGARAASVCAPKHPAPKSARRGTRYPARGGAEKGEGPGAQMSECGAKISANLRE